MSALEEKQQKRFQFLKRFYDTTGGSERVIVNMWDIGKELGWDKETTDVTVQYLVGEGLIKHLTMGGGLIITHWGVKQIEEAMANPEQETAYFPPFVNLIQVETMINSQIQQASPQAIQTQITEDQFDFDAVRDFIEALKSNMDQLEISNSSRRNLEGEIATVEAQMQVSKPKVPFIRECLRSIRSILEEAVGGLVVAGLIEKISRL